MKYDYRGYTIDHQRSYAHAWKGDQENRLPDVAAVDLDACKQVIDILREDEARHAAENPIVPI